MAISAETVSRVGSKFAERRAQQTGINRQGKFMPDTTNAFSRQKFLEDEKNASKDKWGRTQKQNLDIINSNSEIKSYLEKARKGKINSDAAQQSASNARFSMSPNNQGTDIAIQNYNSQYASYYKEYKEAIDKLNDLGYDANSLFDTYTRMQNKSDTAELTKQAADFADKYPVSSGVAYSGLNLMQTSSMPRLAKDAIAAAIAKKNGDYVPYDINSAAFGVTNIRDAIAEENSKNIADKVEDKTGSEGLANAASQLYGIGLSMGDTVFRSFLSPALSGVIAGENAALSTAKDATERGLSADKAGLTGLDAGLNESIGEAVSLGNLKAFKNSKNLAGSVLKQAVVEGSEESVTDVLNAIGDRLINGDNSAVMQQYNELIANGTSEADAEKAVVTDFVKQLGQSFLGGAVSGGVLGSGAAVYNNAVRSSQYKSAGNAILDDNRRAGQGEQTRFTGLIDTALAVSENDKNVAKTLKNTYDDSKSIGRLHYAVEQYFNDALSKAETADDLKSSYDSLMKQSKGIYALDLTEMYKQKQSVLGYVQKNTTVGSNSDVKHSKKLGRYADVNVNVDNELSYYGINNTSKALKDYVGIQKSVVNQLKADNFFNENNRNITVNADTDIVVELSPKGIAETLSKGKRFETLPRKFKEAKLATIRSLPEMIKYAEVKELNQPNYHGNKMADYLVLEHPCTVGNDTFDVEIKIKKTPQNNKFYIHNLTLKNNEMNSTIEENAENSDITSLISNSSHKSNISQNKIDVKKKAEFEAVKNSQFTGVKNLGTVKDKTQKAEIKLLDGFAKDKGLSVIVVDNIEEINGENANAMAENGKIVIGLDTDNGMLLPYAGHELFHILKQNKGSSKITDELQNFIIDTLKNNSSYGYEERFNALQKKYGTNNADIINEEIAANACFTVFSEQHNFESLVNQNRSLAQRVRDFFAEFVEKIKSRLVNLAKLNPEYKALQNDITAQQKIVDMMNTALNEYQKNNTAEKNSVKYALKSYTEKQIENWKNSNKIVVYQTQEQLQQFIDDAKKHKNLHQKMYFGMASEELVNKIKSVSNIDVSGCNLTLRADNILKIFKSHGNNSIEQLRGQRAITDNDILKLPDLLGDISSVEYGGEYVDASKKSTPFINMKSDLDRSITIGAFKQGKYLDLRIQTMYAQNKKGNNAVTADVQASALTPETSHGKVSFDSNVPQNNTSVNNNSMQGDLKYSLRDSDGNELSKQQQEYFKDSKVRDENGNLLVMYHQTGADFTVFNTDNQQAGKYDSETPTGIFLKPTKKDIGLSGKKQMKVYVNMVNPLTFSSRSEAKGYYEMHISGYKEALQKISDIDKEYQKKYDEADIRTDEVYKQLWQDFKDKKITAQEFKRGVEDTETKRILNEWTNASDNARLDAKLLIDSYFASSDYDGVILETDKGSFGRTVKSYIIFNSNQAKNTDNLNPTSNEDIRFAKREQPYSYGALTSKPDMPITVIDDGVIYNADSQTRKDIINQSVENAKKVGTVNENGNAVIYVDDIGTDIIVPKGAIKHSLDRRLNVNAHIALDVGNILKNAIRINELQPRNDNIEKSYVLIGIAKNKDNEPYVVSFVVNRNTNEISSIDVLYAVNAKKEPTGSSKSPQVSTPATGSKISISDLFDYVNKYFPDILPEDVLRHYGYSERPEGIIGESTLYSLRETDEDYKKLLEENAYLQEANELLQQELQLTEGHKLNQKQINTTVNKLIENHGAYGVDKDLLTNKLTGLYNYIANAGTDIDSDYVWNTANDIGKIIADASSVKDTSFYDKYKSLKKRIRETVVYVPSEVKKEVSAYTNLNRFRIRTTKGAGIELDSFYNDLSSNYPELFDSDIVSETDRLSKITEVYESIAPIYSDRVSPLGYSPEEYTSIIASEVFDRYFDVKETHTFADKKQKEIDLLRAHYRNTIDDMKQSYKTRYKAREQELYDRIKQTRQKGNEKLIKQKAHFQEVSKAGSERRKRSVIKASIRKSLRKLASFGAKSDKKKHIPNSIVDSVKALAQSIILEDTKQDILIKNKLSEFQNGFEQIKDDSQYSVISELYNNYINDKIIDLKNKISNTTLNNLSTDTLQEIDDIIKMTVQSINNINRLFGKTRSDTIDDLVYNISAELALYKKDTIYKGALKSFVFDSMKPEYFFEYLDSKTFKGLFDDLRKGEDTWAVDISEAKAYADKIRKKYNYKNWDDKTVKKFKTLYGDIELTLQERLAIYANSLGEHTRNHLEGCGFKYYQSEETVWNRIKHHFKVKNDVSNHRLSEADILKIASSLTDEQQNYVKDMIKYLSEVMGEKGNQVSRELYGVELFKEKMYYPAKVDENSTEKNNKPMEVKAGKKIKNAGFTNSTVKNAKNPIVLMDFDDVWASHIDEMSKYHAFALALENIDRVFNYHTVDSNNNSFSMRDAIRKSFGDEANRYIDNLLNDINGNSVQGAGMGIASSLISKFKKNAVFASASVAIQQPSAIGRALSEIDAAYFLKTTGTGFSRSDYEEMKEYAPVAMIKEMGYFDTNMAKSTVDYLNSAQYDGVAEKVRAFFKDGSYRDEAMSFFASKADEITWTHIWNAVKEETKAKHKNLSKEKMLEIAGERFTEVITKTQVYDSVFSRSGFMRSKDLFMKSATAFMAEPTTSLNMFFNAVVQTKRGNMSKAKGARVFGALVTASVINSLLQSIVTAARADDDDDKKWSEVYLAQLLPNFIDILNPLNQIIFIRDIFNILKGYDVERADMNLFTNLADAVAKMRSDKVSDADKFMGLAGAVSAFFGLPVKNVYRDFKAVLNIKNDFVKDKKFSKENATEIFNEELNSCLGITLFKEDLDKAISAVEEGNTDEYDKYAEKIYASDDAYDLLYAVYYQYGENSSEYRKAKEQCIRIKKEKGAKNPNPDNSMKNKKKKELEKYAEFKNGKNYIKAEKARKRCIQLYGSMDKVNKALKELEEENSSDD